MNAIQQVRRGQTKVSVFLRAQLQASMPIASTSIGDATSGLVIKYHRIGNGVDGGTSVVPVSIANLSNAHNPGGIKHIADGYYRVDLPDAACAIAEGVDQVLVTATVTGSVFTGRVIQLVSGDRSPLATTPERY